jgi:hypothetical protein
VETEWHKIISLHAGHPYLYELMDICDSPARNKSEMLRNQSALKPVKAG